MLSNNLRVLRTERNLTQEEVAKKLNIKRQSYSAYERGINTPDIETIKMLATIFDVSIDYLLEYESISTQFNLEDIALLEKINKLDKYGKNLVTAFIDLELTNPDNLTISGGAFMPDNLTKDADKLISIIYARFLNKRNQGFSKSDAKQFDDFETLHSEVNIKDSVEDIKDTGEELKKLGFLDYKVYITGETSPIILTDSAIVYMENRFKNGAKEVLEYIEKIAGIVSLFKPV